MVLIMFGFMIYNELCFPTGLTRWTTSPPATTSPSSSSGSLSTFRQRWAFSDGSQRFGMVLSFLSYFWAFSDGSQLSKMVLGFLKWFSTFWECSQISDIFLSFLRCFSALYMVLGLLGWFSVFWDYFETSLWILNWQRRFLILRDDSSHDISLATLMYFFLFLIPNCLRFPRPGRYVFPPSQTNPW